MTCPEVRAILIGLTDKTVIIFFRDFCRPLMMMWVSYFCQSLYKILNQVFHFKILPEFKVSLLFVYFKVSEKQREFAAPVILYLPHSHRRYEHNHYHHESTTCSSLSGGTTRRLQPSVTGSIHGWSRSHLTLFWWLPT